MELTLNLLIFLGKNVFKHLKGYHLLSESLLFSWNEARLNLGTNCISLENYHLQFNVELET
jgi:hypothetical protein